MTRDEAAAHVGISRKLAAFHLDTLVDAGLLRAHYAQLAGVRRVGRAPKVYEPTDDSVQISIPSAATNCSPSSCSRLYSSNAPMSRRRPPRCASPASAGRTWAPRNEPAKAPDLVCGVNHAFLTGFLAGLGAPTLHALLVPTPGECCVRLSARD